MKYQKAIARFTLVFYLMTSTAFGQQIVVDGNTQTTLQVNGNVTGITTQTVKGVNAYNSFHTFDVHQGNVVNLMLPENTNNLLNLVHGQRSNINGILNSFKNGEIGGNVFFANPHGMVIGTTGVVNVGSLTLTTPTQNYMGEFFTAPGIPLIDSTNSLLSNTVPINPDGLVLVLGRINARNDINLFGGSVFNEGDLLSGARFEGTSVDFSDVVNIKNSQSGTQFAIAENGDIQIVATRDIVSSGSIRTEGGDNVDGGTITMTAGDDITLEGSSVVSARGRGENSNGGTINIFAANNASLNDSATIDVRGGSISGDGGFAEFSAKNVIDINGGSLLAGAVNGRAGLTLIDPLALNITGDFFTGGGDHIFQADDTLTVGVNVTISSRMILGTDHLNGGSTGNSGNLTFQSRQITVNDGANILAHADNGFSSGDVSFNVEDITNLTFASGNPFFKTKTADASIAIGSANITGNNINMTALASTSKLAVLDEDDLGSPVPTELESMINEDAIFNFSALGAVVRSDATAEITVGSGATFTADNDITMRSDALANAEVNTLGTVLGVTYANSNATAKTIVETGATLTAGNALDLKALASNTIDISQKTVNGVNFPGVGTITSLPEIGFAYGKGTTTSEAGIQSGVTVNADSVNILAENRNDFSVGASGFVLQPDNYGVAVNVAISNMTSTATAYLDGDATITNDVNVLAKAINDNSDTRASSTVKNKPDASGPLGSQQASVIGFLSGSDLHKNSNPNALDLAGAVSFVRNSNTATARIGANADVQAGGNVTVDALAEDNFQVSATSSAGEGAISVGGSIISSKYSNTANAYIGDNALVDLGKVLTVNADARIPNQVDYFNFSFDYDFVSFGDQDSQAGFLGNAWNWGSTNIPEALSETLDELSPYLNTNLGVANKVATSYISTSGTVSDTGTIGFAGSVNLLEMNNTSDAYIGQNAKVNTRNTSTEQQVNVTANSTIETVNIIGMPSIIGIATLNPGLKGGGNQLGGSYSQPTYNNKATAHIDDGATVATHAPVGGTPPDDPSDLTIDDGKGLNDIVVEATTDNYLVGVTVAGGNSKKLGVVGAFSVPSFNNTTLAYVQDTANIDAGDDLTIIASNDILAINTSGAVGKSATAGVGASVSWTRIDNHTKAFIGDINNPDGTPSPTALRGTINAGEDVSLSATSKERIYGISVAGAVQSAATSGDANEGGGKSGFGASGDIAFNRTADETLAYIADDVDVTAGGAVNLDATNELFDVTIGGSLGIGTNLGIGGSYSQHNVDRLAKAYTENATITADSLNVTATTNDKLLAVTVGASGSTKGAAIAGSVNLNLINNTTEAAIGANTTVNIENDIVVNADSDLNLVSIAGGVAVTSKFGFGLGIDIGVIDNDAKAYIDGSATIERAGNIDIDASSDLDLVVIAASLAISGSGASGAGSVSTQTILNDAKAYIGAGAQIGTLEDVQDVSIDAVNDTYLVSIAGGGAGGSTAGAGGAGSNINLDRDTLSYIGNGATINTAGNLTIGAETLTNLWSFAGFIGGGGFGVAVSGSGITIFDETKAYIDDDATIDAEGSVVVAADSDGTAVNIAGAIGAGTSTGAAGIAATLLIRNDLVEARIGSGAKVTARGNGVAIDVRTGERDTNGDLVTASSRGVTVTATSREKLTTIAIGGAGAGSVGGAGSATVNVVTEDTTATIADTARINEFNVGAHVDQSVAVVAEDSLRMLTIAGAGGFGGTGGIGAGADVGVITKNTNANIGASTVTNAENNILVLAKSQEDINSYVVTAAGGGSFGVAGSGSVYVLNVETDAHIGSNATADAKGNVLVSAEETNDLDLIAGSGAGGGSGGVGASFGVAVVTKNTRAYIGDNANVTALGLRDAIDVNTGRFVVEFTPFPNDDSEIAAPNSNVTDANTQSFSLQRGATAETRAMKGLAVTAVNQDSISTIAATGAGSGAVTVTIAASSSVNVNNTDAYIGNGAKINLDNTGAGAEQSVHVAAANDFFHLGVAGSGSGGGAFGVGPAGEITISKNNTNAHIGSNATVNAEEDVSVVADSTEEIVTLGVGLGIGGTVGVAGTLNLTIIANDTKAYIDNDATVVADGNVLVSANDDTTAALASGSVSLGFGAAGVGGSVGITTINKNTQAYIGDRAGVTGNGNSANVMRVADGTLTSAGAAAKDAKGVAVQADSEENLYSFVGAGSGGFFAGVAGAVSVSVVKSDTTAYVGEQAMINADTTNAAVDQDVNVSATNEVDMLTFGGGISGGAVGVAGGVDVGVVKNNTTAYIGNDAKTNAAQDIEVNALSKKDARTIAVSASGGIVGIAGSVSVYAIGENLDSDSMNSTNANGNRMDSYADQQAQGTATQGLLNSYQDTGGSGDPDIPDNSALLATHMGNAGTTLGGSTPSSPVSGTFGDTSVPQGTAAFIGAGTETHAGRDINVRAKEDIDLDIFVGGLAVGGAGIGGSVGIANVRSNTRAYIDTSATVGSVGDILVNAKYDTDLDGLALAGQLGGVGLGASYISIKEDSDQTAYIGDNAVIEEAGQVIVKAEADKNVDVDAKQGAIGAAVALGAAIAIATTNGSTNAHIGNGVHGGQLPGKRVNNVSVLADSESTTRSRADALSGGLGLSVAANVATAKVNSDVDAYIGDNVVLDVEQDISVRGLSESSTNSRVNGLSIGVAAAGLTKSLAQSTTNVNAHIGTNSDLEAGQSISVLADHNVDENGQPIAANKNVASGQATSGGLVGGTISFAEANATSTVNAYVDNGTTLTAGDDVKIASRVSNIVSSDLNSNAFGLAAGGLASAKSKVFNRNSAYTGSNVTIDAGRDAVLSAESNSVIEKTRSNGGIGGLVAGALAQTRAEIDTQTIATVGTGTSITAAQQILVQALTSIEAHSHASVNTGALLSINKADAKVTVRNLTKVEIGPNTTLIGDDVLLQARVTKMDVDALATSKTFAANSTSEALATVDTISDTQVNVRAGSDITGRTRIAMISRHDGVDTDADANSKITAGFTGSVTAIGTNDLNLDSDILVESGVALRTNDLVLEAFSPHDAIAYDRTAESEAATVIKWITQTVKKVKQVVEWIPFFGKLISEAICWVTETVAQFLNSDETATLAGSRATNNSITLNGDVFQGASVNPLLIVDQNGTFTDQRYVTAHLDGIDVVVDDIFNDSETSIFISSISGDVSGNATFHQQNSFENITLINNSAGNFRIGDIGVIGDNAGEPNIQIFAAHNLSNFATISDVLANDVFITNNSASNVVFEGRLENPSGNTDIFNLNGNIFGSAGHLVQSNTLVLSASNGQIGDASIPLNIDLVDDVSAATFDALANGPMFLDVGVVKFLGRPLTQDGTPVNELVVPDTINAEFNGVLSGDAVNMALRQGTVIVENADGTSTIQNTVGNYQVNNEFTAAGDINIAAIGDSVLDIEGTLTSGIKDITFRVNADGSIDTSKINYTDLIDDDTVSIEFIESKGGNVTIVGDVQGNGTIRALDGFSHIDIANDSDKTLLLTDLDISDRVEGRININGVDKTLPGTENGVTLTTYGYETGSVDFQNNGASDIHLAGVIANASGKTTLSAAFGDIERISGRQLLVATDIELNAQNGHIGTFGENIYIDLTASRLDAFAKGDIHITEVDGDLGLGSLLSLTGDIQLIADGSIFDAAPEDIINLLAGRVALLALNGGIGTLDKRVVADTFGIFNMVAAGNIFIEERIGTFVAAGSTIPEQQFGNLIADHGLGGDVLDLFMPSGLPTIRQVFFKKNIIIRIGDVNRDIDNIETTVFSPYAPEQMKDEKYATQSDDARDEEDVYWMEVDPSLVEIGQD